MKTHEVLQYDKQFSQNNWMWNINIQKKDFSTFKIIKNKSKILISAPHSVSHVREWEILPIDFLTWWLTLYLGKRLNAPIIYSTSIHVWDPNFDNNDTSEYKQSLLKFINDNNIKLLIDLHWCRSVRDFSVELWTWWIWDPNLQWHTEISDNIIESLNTNLKTYISHSKKPITKNTIFSASKENTVSNFISNNANIPAIQLEINQELRDVNNIDNLSLLINALENMINNLSTLEYFKN